MPILIKRFLLAFLLAITACNVFGQPPKTVVLYAYHLMPPYLITLDNEQGLYFDLARYLNAKGAKYHFEVEYLPRKRIERMLKSDKLDGALIGVSPVWFKDKNETKYLWTDSVLSDRDQVVSLISRPFEYTGPASLKAKTLGGVLGFYYFGVDELVQQGAVYRVNTHSQSALLSMILSRRVDAGIVSDAALKYLTAQNNWHGKFHVSQQPHDQFDRRVLVPKKYPRLYKELQRLIVGIDTDPAWIQQQARYQ